MNDATDLNRQPTPKSGSSTALESRSFEPQEILYAGEERSGNLFVEYFRTLARHRGLIALLGMAGIVASFIWNFDTLPVYRARTSLDIQSLNSDFMNMKAVAPTGEGTDPAQGDYLQTQIKLLQSDTLLERTIDHMKADPHPQYVRQMDLASRVERALYLSRDKELPYGDVVDDAAKRITVKPMGVTRLVEITCDSWSPDVSAKFCNTLVEQFKVGDLEMREKESQKTSDWLTQRVKDVKAEAEESEKQLEAATGGNGLVLSQESTGVEEDRLRAVQGEYVKAQADRMQKEAAAGIGSAPEPDLSESPSYRQSEQELARLQGEVAKLVPPRTEEDPQVIHLRSQIKVAEANMAAARVANASHLKSDYEAAVHREAMLAAAYRREESMVSSDLGKASRVNLLRSELQGKQQLYQTLLSLARQAGLASVIHASTVRIVDAAKPPNIPFSPRRGSSAASGLLMGTLCGVGLAFFLERTTTVFRVPGETERFLGLCELGVIPSSPRPKALPIPMNTSPGAQLIPPRETHTAFSTWSEKFSIVAEAYRNATTSIMLSEHPRENGRVYVLSSANAGEGKTTVTSNLGVALSKSRLRVLLIDGDLRKPALHKVLQVSNEFGLRNLLRGEVVALSDPSTPVYQTTSLPNLFVLPAGQGSEEVVELLHSPNVAELIKGFRSSFDIVIIDTPPMLHLADTRVLASHAQGAILVVRAGSTTRDEALKARDLFGQDRVRVIGTILNDFSPEKNGLTNYYKSYYRYVEGDATSVNEAPSWLGGLLSRDRWMMQPHSDSGSVSGPLTIDPERANSEAQQQGATDGASSSVIAKKHSDHPGAESLDVFVSHLFTKLFKRDALPDRATEIESLADGAIWSDAPAILDRRRAIRQQGPQLFAHYWDGGTPQAHDVRDISATGLYLLAQERWYPGTQVMILLQRPGATEADVDRSIKVKARVVRFGEDGLAFEFVMPEKHQPAKGIPEQFVARRAELGENGADGRELQRFLQRLPNNGSHA